VYQCSAELAAADTATTWTMRTSFPEYVIAIVTIVGSILFAVCASSLYIASQEALNTSVAWRRILFQSCLNYCLVLVSKVMSVM
jgi:hypothetical protein